MTSRQQKALELLRDYQSQTYKLLGEGMSSVVFNTEQWVYKVFLLQDIAALSYKKLQLQAIQSRLGAFENSAFFYPIKEILQIDEDTYILIYPFEKSVPCTELHYEETIAFLVECWQKRIIFQDIKPDNFVRVNGLLKWIDYEPDKFNDNLFLNMATRAFIYCKYPNESEEYLQKLNRSAINQFQLAELEGLQSFLNKVFTTIVYNESKSSFSDAEIDLGVYNSEKLVTEAPFDADATSFLLPYSESFNAENGYWEGFTKGCVMHTFDFDTPFVSDKNYFAPKNIVIKATKQRAPIAKVSMIIKACIQDSGVVGACVKHIVKQTALPNSFDEIILALDNKESDFLRQYNTIVLVHGKSYLLKLINYLKKESFLE